MPTSFKIINTENRIHVLTQRDPVMNKRIINKLKRKLRRLTGND